MRFVKNYTEELTATSPRHPAVVQLRTGVKKDGTLWAWEGKTFYNGGAYGAYKPNPQGSMSCLHGRGLVQYSAHAAPRLLCLHQSVSGGYFRAPGEAQTLFAVESHVDMIADAMGIDPMEFRLRNGLKKGDTWALARISVIPTAPKCSSAWRKFGLGKSRPVKTVTPVKTGRGMALGDRHVGHGDLSFELVLERNGTLRLLSGVGDQGVGYTMHRQVVSALLGVDPYSIRIVVGNTSTRPTTKGSKERAARISKDKPCCGRPTR